MQLTTSRSDFSGELALKKKILRHSLPLVCFAVILAATHSHTCSLHLLYPLVLLSTHIHSLHSFSLLLPRPLSTVPQSIPPLSSLLVSITDKRYFVVGGNTISSPVPELGWKSVAGVQRMRAMNLNLKVIMALCTRRGYYRSIGESRAHICSLQLSMFLIVWAQYKLGWTWFFRSGFAIGLI